MVNQKKDRLLNDYLSPLDITATQFKVLCSIRCEVCITPVELKKVLSVDLGALTRMLDRLVCKGWVERSPNPNDKRGVLVRLTSDDEVATLELLLKKILPILDWIEDNLESPLSLEKVSERSGYSKWHLQRMFKKETGHSLGQYIRSRKLTEIAQKLKESNEPILYLAERYGFESQQTLTRTFKNYFDVPPHKYRITSVPDVTEEKMKVTASAALALLVLFSSQTFAEQTPGATQQNNHDTMILPSAHDQSPYDFNHMGAAAGLFYALSPYPRRPANPQAKHVDVQPGHDQHGTEQLQSAQRFIQQYRRTGKPHYRNQQRQRRDAPGLIAPQQRTPDPVAHDGGDKRQIDKRKDRGQIDLDQAVQHHLRAIQNKRRHQKRDYRNQCAPDHQGHHLRPRLVLHNQLVENIAARPAQPRRQREHKPEQRHILTVQAGFNQHQHAKYRQRYPRQLLALQAFAKHKCAENNGKERLRL
ncbi:hypothetical protein ID866_1796 [Astraeus odoratus]|nr:hypothetical protein ID866_1796 [Astraeus odoratus]